MLTLLQPMKIPRFGVAGRFMLSRILIFADYAVNTSRASAIALAITSTKTVKTSSSIDSDVASKAIDLNCDHITQESTEAACRLHASAPSRSQRSAWSVIRLLHNSAFASRIKFDNFSESVLRSRRRVSNRILKRGSRGVRRVRCRRLQSASRDVTAGRVAKSVADGRRGRCLSKNAVDARCRSSSAYQAELILLASIGAPGWFRIQHRSVL